MKLDETLAYAEELSVLRDFPARDAAIAKIAELIAQLCANRRQARALVDAMTDGRRFDRWEGPATLRQVHSELFSSTSSNTVFPGFDRPPIDCQRCTDNGQFVGSHGRMERCTCEAGRALPQEVIDAFERMLQISRKFSKPVRGAA